MPNIISYSHYVSEVQHLKFSILSFFYIRTTIFVSKELRSDFLLRLKDDQLIMKSCSYINAYLFIIVK